MNRYIVIGIGESKDCPTFYQQFRIEVCAKNIDEARKITNSMYKGCVIHNVELV